jgi:zinc protease
MLWVRVGSMDEVDGTSGVAHVLEHMMFKGTPDVGRRASSRAAWRRWAGAKTPSPARDYTGYYQQIPARTGWKT